MDINQLKVYYKKECNKDIPAGWDTSEEQCLEFIIKDSYACGYNDAKKYLINQNIKMC